MKNPFKNRHLSHFVDRGVNAIIIAGKLNWSILLCNPYAACKRGRKRVKTLSRHQKVDRGGFLGYNDSGMDKIQMLKVVGRTTERYE